MTIAPAETSKFSVILRFLGACAIFAVAALIVFGDVLFRSGQVVSVWGTDICNQFYGWRQFGFTEMGRGHLALWNPYVFCGAPYLGGFQSALLYPPNWLYLAIRDLPTAINVGAALNVFLSGVFMYCWAAYRRLHWLACVAAGLMFMLGGPQMAQLLAGHLPNACTLIWAPLIFLAIDDLAMTASPRALFLGTAAVALQVLAGHPQYVFFTAVGAGIYLLLNLFLTSHRWKLLGGFVLFYLCGALLSAMQLLTGLQAATEGLRTKLSVEIASTFSFPPEDLLTMVLPKVFGGYGGVRYWGRWFYWEMSAFIGVTGLVLVICAVAVPWRQRRFAFTMLCVTFLLALGKYTPLGQVIFRLPGFDSFRGISKFMFLVLMFLAMLGGMGFDWLLRGGQVRKWFLEYLGGAALLFIVAAITIIISAHSKSSGMWGQMLHSLASTKPGEERWMYQPFQVTEDVIQQTAKAAMTDLWWAAGTCVVVGGILIAGRRDPRAYWALAAVMAVELVVFAQAVHGSFPAAELKKESDATVDFVSNAFHGQYPQDMRIWSYGQGDFLVAHRYNTWGDDPMMLRRYVDLMAATLGMQADEMISVKAVPPPKVYENSPTPLKNYLDWWDAPERQTVWKLTRTGGLLVDTRYWGGRFVPIYFTLPRAKLIGTIRVEPDREKIMREMTELNQQTQAPDFDPMDTAFVESPITPAPAGVHQFAPVTVTDYDSDTLDIDTTTTAPCLLLITDAYSTGWHAEAMPDSIQQAYQVIPADLAFRGIPLTTPGHHHFELVYRPTGFVVGEWTTVASLIAYLAGLMFWAGLRFMKSPAAPVAPETEITSATQT